MAFRVHINIGSNKGDRNSAISRAVALLSSSPQLSVVEVSDIISSDPWGFDSPNSFLNVGVEISTSLSPLPLLSLLQDIERSISPDSHRDTDGISYIDRLIDIDIIAIDRVDVDGISTPLVIDHPRLRVPHPLLHLRPFVLTPMIQLRPSWIHPLLHLTPAQMLRDLC